MSVTVELADGTEYSMEDVDGLQFAYTVLPGGGLALLVKEKGQTLAIEREFSPSGYNWVEGKRYGGELKSQAGRDGKLEFPGARLLS